MKTSLFQAQLSDIESLAVSSTLPSLPETVADRFGHQVITTSERWAIFDLGDPMILKWAGFSALSPDLVHALKLYLCHCLTIHSPTEAINTFKDIKRCAGMIGSPAVPCASLSMAAFDLLRTELRKQKAEHVLHRFRKWYAWMVDQDLPTASREIAREVSEWRIPGNVKGVAVMSMDPRLGPLDDAEHFALTRSVREWGGSLLHKAVVMLCLELGANPRNLLLLEERDLFRIEIASLNKPLFQLAVPRIKKRQSKRDTKRRAISEELGAVLEELVKRNRDLDGGPNPHRPILFREAARNLSQFGEATTRYIHHHTRGEILKMVRRFTLTSAIASPRTGEALEISVRRLRYTFATRMARQGAPASVIAELLDHSDLQNVMVYVRSGPEVIKRLDQAVGKQMKPIVDRFLGRVVVSEAEADPPNDPSQRIYGKTPTLLNLGGIGTCGKKTLCTLYPPLSCYLCSRFQPWKDGPHLRMLEELQTYVEELGAKGDHNPSNRIVSQLDEALVAVEQVIRLCGQSDEPTTEPLAI